LTEVGDIIRCRTFDAFFPVIMVAVRYFLIAWLCWGDEGGERRNDPRASLRRAQV
jgi:polar amino acid transport system substrate-binding protein